MTCEERIYSNEYVDIITSYQVPTNQFLTEEPDYCYIPIDDSYYAVYLNKSQIPPLSVSTYTYATIPKVYGLMQEPFDPLSLVNTGISRVQRPPLSLTGRGVIMAFIDTGIDYTSPVFQNADGSTRILTIWDQTIAKGEPEAGGAPEETPYRTSDQAPYRTADGVLLTGTDSNRATVTSTQVPYGTIYNREQINQALRSTNSLGLVPTMDSNGHGSAMASVAAGSSIKQGQEFTGAAPESDILVVKLKECKQYLRDYYLIPREVPAYEETDIMLGVQFAMSFLQPLLRPVVICLGIGTNQGGHSGNSALNQYLDTISKRRSTGVVICGGNEGNAAHHYSNTLLASGNNEEYQDVEIRVGQDEPGFLVEFWGNAPDTFGLSIRSPAGESIPRLQLNLGQSITYNFIYERTEITIDSLLVEQGSGDELITMRFVAPTPGVWTIRVFATDNIFNGVYHMWLPIKAFMSGNTYFLEPSPYVTLTEPAMTREAIAVSTYNDLNNSFYTESGRGYARNGTIAPTLAAPGVNVSTLYGKQTGSSLAAAFMAGAAAQFLQWAVVEKNSIYVGNRELKSYFIRGASRTADVIYPNREWGYGRLNIEGVFKVLAGV